MAETKRGGLSPLARGTRFTPDDNGIITRFIPAGAGNTNRRAGPVRAVTVYPRWRGEHAGTVKSGPGNIGLSPLARGTRRATLVSLRVIRFIPAGAGNTVLGKVLSRFFSVYPRWRGEHYHGIHRMSCGAGLSPLARGTLFWYCLRGENTRFIPAGAGNTWNAASSMTTLPVYPRWRGEHSKSTQLNLNTFLAHKKPTNFS